VDLRLPAVAGVRSGLIGTAAVEGAADSAAATTLPVGTLFAVRAGEGFVWALEPGGTRVRPLMVRLGAVGERGVAVEGVPPGTRVVVGGLERLSAGARVRVIG
jgi:hypothetical protein